LRTSQLQISSRLRAVVVGLVVAIWLASFACVMFAQTELQNVESERRAAVATADVQRIELFSFRMLLLVAGQQRAFLLAANQAVEQEAYILDGQLDELTEQNEELSVTVSDLEVSIEKLEGELQ